MKKLILFFLIIAEFHFTQDFDQRNYLSSNQIKDKIYQNLEKIELQFLRKLNNNDYLKAKEIIFDSYLLLFSIPDLEFDDHLIMSEQDFKQLVSDLKNESFTEDKLTIIELVSNSNNFTVSQVYQILETIDFSEDRIEAIELLYPSVVDKYNSYRLLSLFNNSTDKQTVRNIISNYNYLRR